MEPKKRKKDTVLICLDFIRLIIITCVIAQLFQTFVMRKNEVIGSSMYPTLEEDEIVFINIAANLFTEIDRFDVVVVKNESTDELWVKRVIGMPNETVEFKRDHLYIDGKEYNQDFLDSSYMEQMKTSNKLEYFTTDYTAKLGEDEYLLVGDNRPTSLDSRNESIGPFKREQIIAKGVLVVYPFSKVRYVADGD